MPPRCFTPELARRTVERLRPTLERIRALVDTLERRRPARCGPEQLVDPGYFRLVERLDALLRDVRRAGAVVADPRRGGVRFPARREGRPALLAWYTDRPSLRWSAAGRERDGWRPVVDDDGWDVD